MRHVVVFSYLLVILLLSQIRDAQANIHVSKKLAKRMNAFFTEVLSRNYQGKNEQDLYEQFLTGYYNAWNNVVGMNLPEFDLKVDHEKLTKINEELFKRDFSHYYYFFREVIVLKPGDDIIKAREWFNHYPDIPITIKIEGKKNESLLISGFSKVHSVHLSFPKGFIEDIQGNDLKTVSYVNWTREHIGEFPFFFMASFFTQSDAREELRFEVVRQIVAVVFWKYLCIQAGVDFHALPKDCNRFRPFES